VIKVVVQDSMNLVLNNFAILLELKLVETVLMDTDQL
jgi:hypothetical protein